jgi:hypothetical protein
MQQPKKPLGLKKPKMISVKRAKEMSDSLMRESVGKKMLANQQEKIGRAFIKAGNGDWTKVLDLKGTTSPTAFERLKIARNAKASASADSAKSVKLKNLVKNIK